MKKIQMALVLALTVSVLTGISSVTTASATVTSCDGSSTQNNITVTAKNGKIFYVDSSSSQKVDAAYVAYQIASTTAKTNLWARVDTFIGGIISLANPADANQPVGDITAGSYKSAFFLLKAKASSLSAQSHVLHVYSAQPGLTGSIEIYSCTFTFTKVSETIKASANKVTSIAPSVTSLILGSTMTVTVQGQTGTIGAGPSSDPNMMWISPVAHSSWPTGALRLTGTSLDFWTNQNQNNSFHVGSGPYVDTLQITSLTSLNGGSSAKLYYQAVYTFKIIGKSSAAAVPAPIAQITSGTQVKHTDMGALPAVTALATNTVTINAHMTKSVSATTSQVANKTQFSYTITLTNPDATSVTFDQVTDTPATALSYVASSVRLDGAATAEPLTDSSGHLIFSQPITVGTTSSVALTYTMQETVACTLTTGFSYLNSAVAIIGSITIGASPSTYPVVTAGGTCGTTPLTTSSTTTATLPIEVQTTPTNPIANTTATLNGLVDPNGTSGQSVIFDYGTNATLSGATSVTLGATTTTATDPYAVSTSLTGLSTGTTYYFRLHVGTVYGDILSFATTSPVAAPNVSTDPASAVSSTDATLNSTVSPNQTPVYAEYQVSTDSSFATNSSVVRLIDDPTVAYSSSTNPDSIFSSASPIYPQINMDAATYGHMLPGYAQASLSGYILNGRTIYYRALLVNVSTLAVITASQTQSFTFTSYVIQTIHFDAISDISWGASAPVIAPFSDSGMTVTITSSTTGVCTISGTTITIVTTGICTLAVDQSGGLKSGTSTYYNPATEVVQSFNVNQIAITATVNVKIKSYGSSDPTLDYSLTGSLLSGDSFTGSLTRVAGETPGTYAISQGTLALSTNYALTFAGANLTITTRAVTLTADAKSKTYGDSDPTFTYSLTSGTLATGDSFSGSLSRSDTSTAVGVYPISKGTLALNSNYAITYVGANLTINARPIAVKADNQTEKPGLNDPVFTYAVTSGSLVGTDIFTGSLARIDTSTVVGTYVISQGTLALSANYAITFTPATLTITNLNIPTIKWSAPSAITYGTKLDATQLNASVQVSQSDTSTVTAGCVYTSSIGDTLTVGSNGLGVTCTPTDSATYAAVSTSVTLIVNPKAITVTPAAQTKVYGDPDPALTYSTAAGAIVGLDTLSGSLTRASGESVNSYSITQGNLANSNYTITFVGSLLSITAKSLTVTVTADNKQYDGGLSSTVHAGTPSGLLPADSSNVAVDATKVTGGFASAGAATGKTVTISVASGVLMGTGAANYSLTAPSNPAADILKAPATVTSDNVSVSQGQRLGTLSYSVTGLVSPETGDPFTGISCISGYLLSDLSGASRHVTCSGGTATNYSPTFVQGIVTITAPSTYAITYDGNSNSGGSVPTSDTYMIGGTALTLPSAGSLARSGYTFGGWSTTNNGTAVSSSYTPGSSLSLYAVWTANAIYNVSYDGNSNSGGTAPGSSLYTVGSNALTLPSVGSLVRRGYTFGGWSTTNNGTAVASSYTPGSSLTLYVVWILVATYAVTYDLGGGSGSTPAQSATASGGIFSIASSSGLTKSGYTFNYWSDGTSAYSSNSSYTMPASLVRLTAIWLANSVPVTYVISFGGNGNSGGTAPGSSLYTVGGTALTLPTVGSLVRRGYTFGGWSTSNSGSAFSSPYTPASSLTLYAVWTAVTTYAFTYNLGGGSGTLPTQSATASGGTFSIASSSGLTKSGYTFNYWSDGTSSYAPNATFTMPASPITLTATWIPNVVTTYVISFDGNSNSGGTAPGSSLYTVGGNALTLPSAGSLVRRGYTFGGWSSSSTGSPVSSPFTPSASGTLSAVWIAVLTPTPTPTPIQELTPGASVATENGVTVPTKVTLIPLTNPAQQPKGVDISGDGWKIQIVGSKTVVKGTPADPTNITIVLIQGLNASTSGTGFKPGTIANVYLFSSKILLGKVLVASDGTFKATFPVSTTIAIGSHTMQVEGIALTGDNRKANVGLLVQSDPNKATKRLGLIDFALNYSGLRKANKNKLNAIAKTVNQVKYKKLWIFGYTDVQTGVNNTVLSKKRATTVKNYLQKLLPKVVIQIKYFGPANPLSTARTKAAYAANRRAEIFGQKDV